MAYVRPRALAGCCGAATAKPCDECVDDEARPDLAILRAVGRGVRQVMGAFDPSQAGSIGAPAGVSPVYYLQAHLNRYTAAAGAPVQHVIAPQPLAMSATASSVDSETATRALWVLSRRAGAASLSFPDQATKQLLQTVGQGWVNPVAYVTKNLATTTDVVRLFADMNNLPPAKGVPQIDGGVRLPIPATHIAALAALGLGFVLMTKKRKRR